MVRLRGPTAQHGRDFFLFVGARAPPNAPRRSMRANGIAIGEAAPSS
jgi:hypothetical protein